MKVPTADTVAMNAIFFSREETNYRYNSLAKRNIILYGRNGFADKLFFWLTPVNSL